MVKGGESLREKVASERRNRRQKRLETRLLKRERRLERLKAKGWDEASLREYEREHKSLAQQLKMRNEPPQIDVQSQKPEEVVVNLPLQAKNTLRIAVVGCGGWFANRAHLPALARIMRKSRVCITVLCGSSHQRALITLRRHGVSLTVQQQSSGVAAFDTLEAYLEYERLLSGSNDPSSGFTVSRHRSLADVCVLLLPIPKMVVAVGMCLRAGKYVISEKPISANSYVSQSLWDSVRFIYAGHRWVVAENWAYKPSLRAACRLVQTEILCQQQKPISYSLELVQSLESSGWRRRGHCRYDGGAARDVGVHYIRALRCLFGEVEGVKECEFVADGKACLLQGTLFHNDYGIQGFLRVDLKENVDASLQQACLTVDFGSSGRLLWDIAKGTFHKHVSDKLPFLLETVVGDSWVTGGVREMLEAALDWFHESEFGRRPDKSPQHSGLKCLRCTPEEAFRDAAVVDAMLGEGGQNSAASVAQSAIVSRGVTGVRRYLPRPLLSRMDRVFINSIGTNTFHPAEVAWCASVCDVVSATAWARENSLGLQPIGTCHSSCLLENNAVSISTSFMSRVLDFCTNKESTDSRNATGAYVRVGAGITLIDLVTLLAPTKYTLPSLPILLNQSVGGAISTGSHGSSVRYGTISDSVVAIRLVFCDGDIKTIVPENFASCPTVKAMVSLDANEVVSSDALLKTARCSGGSLGVITDCILELTPSMPLCRVEVGLNMKEPRISHRIQKLAFETEHCWIQWVVGEVKDLDEAAAITLSRTTDVNSESCSFHYGRCWYPYGGTVTSMMRKARKPQPGEKKHTMQWAFPFSSLGEVIAILQATRSELSSRVVEFKFLKACDLTALAPNSVREGIDSFAHIVALNVWWDLKELHLFEILESRLRVIPGARPHYGKWFSGGKEVFQEVDRSLLRLPCNENIQSDRLPILSVILPVYNAMPWLSTALLDILKQDIVGEQVEILAGDDSSSDGSLDFLVNVAIALGARGSIEIVGNEGIVRCLTPVEAKSLVKERVRNGEAKSINPARLEPFRGADSLKFAEIDDSGPSSDEVVSATAARNRLRVLVSGEYVNCGQGAVMTRCLRLARGSYIGQMESDDARPDGAFQEMLSALRTHPEWDGVASKTECIGWDVVGMKRYVEWQNQQDTPEKMRASRFVEIPSLHQACIFRTPAVYMAIGGQKGCYRDDRKWPVDLHFWLSFFHAGLKIGKVPRTLFYWRQHPGQQTRSHGRLSVSNMRKCKCEFLCMEGGPIWPEASSESVTIEIWSTGKTLDGWVDALSFELNRQGKEAVVVPVQWRPGQARPLVVQGGGVHQRRVRLFAFGMEKVRRQVREIFASDWNDVDCLFVA